MLWVSYVRKIELIITFFWKLHRFLFEPQLSIFIIYPRAVQIYVFLDYTGICFKWHNQSFHLYFFGTSIERIKTNNTVRKYIEYDFSGKHLCKHFLFLRSGASNQQFDTLQYGVSHPVCGQDPFEACCFCCRYFRTYSTSNKIHDLE